MNHRVSVIIPNYNHADFLRERIDSVLNQTVQPFEIIILDDCSSDNSRAMIKEYTTLYPQIIFIPNEKNSGSVFSQWNKGVAAAEGDLIWIAESDDTAAPSLLEKLVARFDDEKVVLAYCQSELINEKGERIASGKIFTEGIDGSLFNNDFTMSGAEYTERFLIHRNTIPNGSAVLFNRKYYEQSGGLPSQLKNTGDWLAWLKILCFGRIAFVAEPLNFFRRHSGSVIAKALAEEKETASKDWYGYEVRYFLNRFLKKNKAGLSPAAHFANAKYMAADGGNLGIQQLKSGNFLKGWKMILRASFYPAFQSGFIKKAFKNK